MTDPDSPAPGALGADLVRVARILTTIAPGLVLALVASGLVEATAAIASPLVAKNLIDSVASSHGSGLVAVPLTWLGVELTLTAARSLAQRGASDGVQTLHARGSLRLTERVLQKACDVAYPKFESGRFVDRLARARQDASVHAVGFGVEALTIARTALVFLGCAALLWTTSIWALPILVAAALPAFAVDASASRRLYTLERANLHRNRQGWYLEWLLTAEQTAKELRSLAVGRWLVGRYHEAHAPFVDGRGALARQHFRRGLLPALFGVGALYGPYLFVVLSTIRGETTLGGMLLFVLAFQQGSAAFAQLLAAIGRALEQHPYVRNLLALLDEPEDDPEQPAVAADVLDDPPELVLDDVWFTYPGTTEPVLRGLSLRVRAGETLAIVGRNGIGKTTMVKLLVGLYPIQRGRILLGGVDLADRSAGWRRANIGVVFQDFVRFQFSARWNVGLGWPDDADDEAGIRRALDKAQATELVGQLDGGLDTPLGPAYGGRDLSGGQWQRIALARLFFRKSRLWVLDEPTSAMDPLAEARTVARFREWTEGRTAILVAHRFSTVRTADRIAVLEGGQVAELGTHDELIARGGAYARLFVSQAEAYQPGPRPTPSEARSP